MHIAAHRNWYVCMSAYGCMHAWVHVCAPWHIVFIQCVCAHSCMSVFTFHLIEIGCLCAVHGAGWPTSIGVFFYLLLSHWEYRHLSTLVHGLTQVLEGGGLMKSRPYAYATSVFANLANLTVHEHLYLVNIKFLMIFKKMFVREKLEACKYYSLLFKKKIAKFK